MVPSPVGPTAATPQMWWPVSPSAPKWTPRRLPSTPSWSTAGASLHPPSPNLCWFYSVSAAAADRGKLDKLGRPRGTPVASGSFGAPPQTPGKGHSGWLWVTLWSLPCRALVSLEMPRLLCTNLGPLSHTGRPGPAHRPRSEHGCSPRSWEACCTASDRACFHPVRKAFSSPLRRWENWGWKGRAKTGT